MPTERLSMRRIRDVLRSRHARRRAQGIQGDGAVKLLQLALGHGSKVNETLHPPAREQFGRVLVGEGDDHG